MNLVYYLLRKKENSCSKVWKVMYSYLVIGGGLFGSVFANEAKKQGKSVLVVDRRNHIGGNLHCQRMDDINIHQYGPHIFHTDDKTIWDYVNRFVSFNNFVNSPIANYHGELYHLPFNMNTFNEMWGISTEEEAKAIIAEQRKAIAGEPKNLEEQAISLVGTDIYEKLIKGYTEKQWGRNCTELPASIIRRLPVRYAFNNNYFDDLYQGIPVGGYNKLINALLEGIEIRTGVDYNLHRKEFEGIAETVVYTGAIDAYFNYRFGALEYRSLRFETERLETADYQGVAVMNYTDKETPYTRIIEHKHFEFGKQPYTYITREYPMEWKLGEEAYYPVNDTKNQKLYEQYAELARKEKNVIFGGRLAEYKYYDMDDVIKSALKCVAQNIRKE